MGYYWVLRPRPPLLLFDFAQSICFLDVFVSHGFCGAVVAGRDASAVVGSRDARASLTAPAATAVVAGRDAFAVVGGRDAGWNVVINFWQRRFTTLS